MSDYGFATYDEKTGKRRLGVVNSKWPIFGPSYNDIKKSFKTFHVTDTYRQDYVYSPDVVLPPPDDYQENIARGVNKILVATIPHGYKFRPLGYVSFSGVFTKNIRCKWDYENAVDTSGLWAPSTILYNVDSSNIPSLSGCDGYIYSTTYNDGAFNVNMYEVDYPEDVYYYLKNPWLEIVDRDDPNSPVVQPYTVEIDDKNIYLYRNTYWMDKYGRWYYEYQSQYVNTKSDLRARSQGVIDWEGSDFDFTIYLAPYRMEDLI